MTESKISFDNGAEYERMMGTWSRLTGDIFLDWLRPARGLRWVDVGCGNGAFTELIAERCAPAAIQGIDPSNGQLEFARARCRRASIEFTSGDAMKLPFPDRSFDAASMALVIFFVPDPARSVAEMARVVRPGGVVATYAWDLMNEGGFPLDPIQSEVRALGYTPARPPMAEASRMDALRALWAGAGLVDVETREIIARRSFDDFEDFWTTSLLGSSMKPTLAAMTAEHIAQLKENVRARMQSDAAGRIAYDARANAIKGRVPG